MAFFDDIFGGLFGQQERPEFQAFNAQDILRGAQANLPAIEALNLGFARQNIPLAEISNQVRGIRYGQDINPLQSETVSRILGNLRLGTQLPEDIRQQAIQNALEGSAASGFGLSPGGRALVARDLGISAYDVGRQREEAAMRALQSFRGPDLQPALGPENAINLELQNLQQDNAMAMEEASRKSANRKAVFESLAEYGGTFTGAALGTNQFGSILRGIGGGVGSSGFTGVGTSSGVAFPGGTGV